MAEKFIGVKMVRNFNWAYTCEHCGKFVEAVSSLYKEYGQKVWKRELSGTGFDLTEQGKQTYLMQGRADFPKACEITLSQWNNGVYPDYIITKQDKCPNCREYQHWGKTITEKGSIVGGIFAAIFGGPFFSLILTLIISIFVKGTALLIIFIILSIVLMAFLIFGAIVGRKDLLQQKAELENKPKQFPQFVSWGNTLEDIHSWA